MKLSYLQKFAVLTLGLLVLDRSPALAASAIQGKPVYSNYSYSNNSYSNNGTPLTLNGLLIYGRTTPVTGQIMSRPITDDGNYSSAVAVPSGALQGYIDLNDLTVNQAAGKPPTGSLSVDKNMVGQNGTVTLQWSVNPSAQ